MSTPGISDVTLLLHDVCSSRYSRHHACAGQSPDARLQRAANVTRERTGDRCWPGAWPCAASIMAVTAAIFMMRALRCDPWRARSRFPPRPPIFSVGPNCLADLQGYAAKHLASGCCDGSLLQLCIGYFFSHPIPARRIVAVTLPPALDCAFMVRPDRGDVAERSGANG
jgi:hypothetical protein